MSSSPPEGKPRGRARLGQDRDRNGDRDRDRDRDRSRAERPRVKEEPPEEKYRPGNNDHRQGSSSSGFNQQQWADYQAQMQQQPPYGIAGYPYGYPGAQPGYPSNPYYGMPYPPTHHGYPIPQASHYQSSTAPDSSGSSHAHTPSDPSGTSSRVSSMPYSSSSSSGESSAPYSSSRGMYSSSSSTIVPSSRYGNGNGNGNGGRNGSGNGGRNGNGSRSDSRDYSRSDSRSDSRSAYSSSSTMRGERSSSVASSTSTFKARPNYGPGSSRSHPYQRPERQAGNGDRMPAPEIKREKEFEEGEVASSDETRTTSSGERTDVEMAPTYPSPSPAPAPAPTPMSVDGNSESGRNGANGGNGENGRNGANGANGNGARPVGRGGVRGRRPLPEIIRTRPDNLANKKGKSGDIVRLQANFFPLETATAFAVYQYRVDFGLEEERIVVRKAWVREHRERLGQNYLFDGSMLFSSGRLSVGDAPINLVSKRQSDNAEVPITIRFITKLEYPHPVYLQILNLVIKKVMTHLNLQVMKRNYFDPQAKVDIRQYNLELWPGYTTSIRQHENQLLLNAEITHKVLRTDTVARFLQDCIRRDGRDWQKNFQAAILGQIVLTDYNNRTYRIDDVDFDKSPGSTFEGKNNEQISFVQYYQNRYGIRIRDARQPLLVSRPTARDIRGGRKTPCLLVPELCRLTGLDDDMRKNNQLMRAMADHTRVNPENRIEKLLAFNRRLQQKPEIGNELRAWDMKLSSRLVEFEGRILGQEKIIAGAHATYMSGQFADWTKELRSKPMLHCATVKTIDVVYAKFMRNDVQNFMRSLAQAARPMNFNLPNPNMVEVQSDRIADIISGLEDNLSNRGEPSLCIFFCGDTQSARYNAIKKRCCCERAIPSQVITSRSARNKNLMSIATKVAIQINCKLGGAPWTIEIPSPSKFMIVGFDCSRDTTEKNKTWGATVASLNKAYNRWFSAVSHHPAGEEVSNYISTDIALALQKYREINNCLPDKIIVYRDGVGDGQLPLVLKHEVEILKDKLTEVYGGPHWKLGFIIVTKRINTRIFYNRKCPPAGTVVDDVITLPEKYDFYLISQTVRQGTVSPTSYNVIFDNLSMPPDYLQRISYKMCHLYYNWSGTVRVPAPCQYAHKLAFLAAQSLHKNIKQSLNTQLFFL